MADRLRTPAGAAALAAAEAAVQAHAGSGVDTLAVVTALRAAGVEPALASAALTQAELRQRAVGKFGADAPRLFFTRIGLEQATRATVARRRAQRLAAAGVRRVADLGCGIGADTLAFARAGLHVLAVDSDATTAHLAEANAAALGLTDLVEVRGQDVSTVDLSTVDAVFCDPARRGPARHGTARDGPHRRVFDPEAYAPPWSFVSALAERFPRTVVKLAPGFDHALIPATAEAQWVSVDGNVVELALWYGPLAEVPRRATVIRQDKAHDLIGTGEQVTPVGPVRSYVVDPDGAVVRSHLVAELAASMAGSLVDPRIAYVFADTAVATPFGRCFAVVEELPFALKRLRSALRDRGIGPLEILKRGVAVDPDHLRRELRLTGSLGATLILLRIGDRPAALLCQPQAR